MKLCFIVNQLYKQGGVEKTLYYRLKNLGNYHDIYLITLENGDRPFYFGALPNITHIDLNLKFSRKSNGSFQRDSLNILKSLIAYSKLQSVLLKIRPQFTINVVGAHNFYFVPHLLYTGKKVLEHHASFCEAYPNNLRKHVMKKFDYHIFLTEEECRLATFIKKNKYIIPNPIQVSNTVHIPYTLKKNRIIAAGRIVDIKGFDRLIEAWHIIHKDFPDWVVEIYGEADASVLKKLEEYIKENYLEKSVYIKKSTPDIIKIMNDSKIYAMTSHYESFSMVLVEAMSVGMSIVAFDCPTGPRNIIGNQTGLLVENNDIESFSIALKKAINDESNSKILASNAMKKSEEFSMGQVIDKWNKFFSVNS